ncbi:MAG: hypothetical protein JEZ06_16955 [Anaerolineaceae bacterium]|nr:hypothetical protein [Anaerolineaceae bacterium]
MKKLILTITFVVLFLLLISCSGKATPTVESIAGKGETAAAYTMVAVLTQSAFETVEAQLTEISKPTKTPSITKTGQTTPTSQTTGSVSTMPGPQSQAQSAYCDWAAYVADITISDSTILYPQQEFTKTWRLQNIGTCTWTKDYKIIHSGGEIMGAPVEVQMPMTVKPGDTVDISINMAAPNLQGSHIGYWNLENDSGQLFGLGAKANGVFWVKIVTGDPSVVSSTTAYSLYGEYCSAYWWSGTGALPCPGNVDAVNGSVNLLSAVTLEGGLVRSLPTIIMSPSDESGGFISGQFPAFFVQAGDRFQSAIGCQEGNYDCNVIFELSYRTGDGQTHLLGSWGHTQDGYTDELDINLNSLAGVAAEFILTVHNNGTSEQDRAYWVSPIIYREN